MLAPEFFKDRFVPAFAPLAAYHRFELLGAEHFPESGRGLLLVTHSAATYELFLTIRAVYLATGRIVRSLADRIWFRVPFLGGWVRRIGVVNASRDEARALLEDEEIVGVPPGGMNEALRPASERYRIRWQGRTGFVRLALETGTPVILGACPAADLIYHLSPSRLTDWAYRRFKVPLMHLRGVGPTLIPRPVHLRLHVAPPIAVPRIESPSLATVGELHSELSRRMQSLIDEAVLADGLPAAATT